MLRIFTALIVGGVLSFPCHAQSKPVVIKGYPENVRPETINDPKEAARLAAQIEAAYGSEPIPEAARMLIAILRGSNMGPGDGWFGPCSTRYTWKWLAARCGVSLTESIPFDKFPGDKALFSRLDRNQNGRIEAEDLDWSDRNPYVQQAYLANRLFRRMDPQGDGKLTRDELGKFFERAAKGKEFLTSDDFRDALLGGMSSSFSPGDAPTPALLVRGLFAGEIGSMTEGPSINDRAPDFTLQKVDKSGNVTLSQLIGRKPLVLVTGNFTCGPFRSFYPDVEAAYQRHRDHAEFLMVYVREAHPTDGWLMESNTKVGVAVAQPKELGERVKVAEQFCERLKPTIPVVVDQMNDVVGRAYSGMPARLYVIDRDGKVAYKSGRGPFGFRVGEMEQALLMALLDAPKP